MTPGESKNLAAEEPRTRPRVERAHHRFPRDTEAVIPVRNPDYDPNPVRQSAQADPLQGWKARSCQATVKDGILSIVGQGDAFLGFAAGKHGGPTTVKLRIKSAEGQAHVDWLPGGTQDKPRTVNYVLPGGDWQEITVQLPATGPLGVLRVYLPIQSQPIEIDWIEISSKAGGKPLRTDF